MARDVAFLCSLHLGHTPDPAGRELARPLRPGSRVVIMPLRGNFVHNSRGSAGGGASPEELVYVPFPPPGLDLDLASMPGGETAGLPYGFRPVMLHVANPLKGSIDVLRTRAVDRPGEPPVTPQSFSVRRDALEGNDALEAAGGIMAGVREIEDRLCHDELSRLPWLDTGQVAAENLPRLLLATNAGRPEAMRLDTIFASPSGFVGLERHIPAEGRPAHDNARRTLLCTAVGHGLVPDDVAYLTSLRRGPALVRGPTVMRCGEDRLDVEHYCAAEPAPWSPGMPMGVAVRLGRG